MCVVGYMYTSASRKAFGCQATRQVLLLFPECLSGRAEIGLQLAASFAHTRRMGVRSNGLWSLSRSVDSTSTGGVRCARLKLGTTLYSRHGCCSSLKRVNATWYPSVRNNKKIYLVFASKPKRCLCLRSDWYGDSRPCSCLGAQNLTSAGLRETNVPPATRSCSLRRNLPRTIYVFGISAKQMWIDIYSAHVFKTDPLPGCTPVWGQVA